MPTTIILNLTAADFLFFDETWPLERLFLETLAASGVEAPADRRDDGFKPYTLSPLWRNQPATSPGPATLDSASYCWRVCLLDDSLTSSVLTALEAAKSLSLNGTSLTIDEVTVEACPYDELARQTLDWVQSHPKRARFIHLEFLTPVILHRLGLPMPLPDPVPIFQHYLLCWDTFAPKERWVNVNVLDGVEAHLALIEHQLETRPVKVDGRSRRPGFLGRVTYKMTAWQKLGLEFLGTLHTLARFGRFCGTGELTMSGLGQTRYTDRRRKRRSAWSA